MRSVVLVSNTNEHTSRPPRLQFVPNALSVVDALTEARQLNSPGLTIQTHVGCVTVVRLTRGRVREDWNNARSTNQAIQRDSRCVAPGSL